MNASNTSNITMGNWTINPDMLFARPSTWGFWVKFIATPVIVLVGIIGNTLSLIVMKSKALRHKSYSHYLSVLAVFDTITLITRQVKNMDEYYIEMNHVPGVFQNFNDAGCKVYTFMEHVSYLMSSWLVVLMAIERLIAVCFPFRNVLICKQSGAVITICSLVTLISATQVFRLTMVEHIPLDGNPEFKVCEAGDKWVALYTSLDIYMYQWTLAFSLPVATISFCNISVLYRVIKVRREIKQKEKNTRYNRAVKKKHRTTCMLLLVSFTYIATLLPLLLLTMVIDISIKVSTDKIKAWDIYVTLMPFLELCAALSLTNYAMNFFIYVLSGKSFRFELLKIFKRNNSPKRLFTARSTRDEFIRISGS